MLRNVIVVFLFLYHVWGYSQEYKIEELVHSGVESSQELKLLEADIDRSKQELRNAKTSYLPRLTLQSSLGVDLLSLGSFDADHSIGSDLILDWNFFQNGLIFFRVAQAKAQVELSEIQRKKQELDFAMKIKDLAYDWVRKGKLVLLLEKEWEHVQQSFQKTELEVKQGTRRRLDLLNAQIQVFEKENQLRKERRDRQMLKRDLERQTGLPWRNNTVVRFSSKLGISLTKSSSMGRGLSRRLEIREGEINVELNRKAVKVAKLARWPRLDLFSGSSFAIDDLDRNQDEFEFRTGIVARYPLYDGGQTKLQIVIAEISERKAVFQLSKTKTQVMEEIERSYEEWRDQRAFLKSVTHQMKKVKEELLESEIEYKNGNLSSLDFQESKLAYQRSRLRLLEQKISVYKAADILARALGVWDLSQLTISEISDSSENEKGSE